MNALQDIKEHLIHTTIQLLESGYPPKELTIRKLAQEAHVAVGLINYHFISKDNLLVEAIDRIIEKASFKELTRLSDKSIDPKERLFIFLEAISKIVVHYKAYSLILLNHEFFSNSFETPRFIEEILKEIRPTCPELEIKWLAIQLIAPLQYVLLKEEGFHQYIDCKDIDYMHFIRLQLKQLGLNHH